MDSPRRERRILCVALDESDAEAHLAELESVELIRANTADEAIATVQEGSVDCVVSSFDLGEVDGVSLCESTRTYDDELPFVLLVDSQEQLRDRAIAAVEADVTRILDETADLEDSVRALVDRYRKRRREREEVAREREMFQSLLENVPLSIYFKDLHGCHERVGWWLIPDESFIENVEGKVYPHAEDVIGTTDFDLYAPEHAKQSVADDKRVMDNGVPLIDKLEEGRTPLGEQLYFSTTKAPRYDENGEIIGLVGVTANVTERVTSNQELERQNERLEEFANIISHDLRNPLNVSLGYVDMLTEQYDEPLLEECHEMLDRMEQLIEEVLTFAREGQTVVDPAPVSLVTIAQEAWRAVDTADATLTVESDLPVEADPARLLRLFENLFRNAIEHGGPDVAVTVGDVGPDFFVEDDGHGIPPEKWDGVFDRGYTTDPAGTGFGLAIVENIANAHGWSASVTEGESGGARFEFVGVTRSSSQ